MIRGLLVLVLIGCAPDTPPVDGDDPTEEGPNENLPDEDPTDTDDNIPIGPCDGEPERPFYADSDGDGHGDPEVVVSDCEAPDGFVDNETDCDDTDLATHPSAREDCNELEVDRDCDGLTGNADAVDAIDAIPAWPDLDLDGWGDASAPAMVHACTLGDGATADNSDCDDTDPLAWPGAPEILADGVDQNCDGVDEIGLWDDFELGDADTETWSDVQGNIWVNTDEFYSNVHSMSLGGGGGTAETHALDTSQCTEIWWWFQSKRGPWWPGLGDFLNVQFFDGNQWVTVDAQEGGDQDYAFTWRNGVIADPTAYRSDFKLRLERVGGNHNSDRFHVDDFFVGCPGIDADGDGQPELLDCDDSQAAHWTDCGLCVDADGDGYGSDCDLGLDCDDADANTYPDHGEMDGDGVDSDCDGHDNRVLADDFELGYGRTTVWSALEHGAALQTDEVANGDYALRLGGNGTAETVTFDTSACLGLAWEYLGQRGPSTPQIGDDVMLEYWDGGQWNTVDTWLGGDGDPAFSLRSGTFSDPAALSSQFKARLIRTPGNVDYRVFYVDDFVLYCDGDNDADGILDSADCDDFSPEHWSDCGGCVDFDWDGYGLGCDLGSDCDDGDASVNPAAMELVGNGLDENCDGLDRAALFDDFEGTRWSDVVWESVGGAHIETGEVGAGAHSVRLDAGADLRTVPFDSFFCSELWWSFLVKRGPLAPEIGSDLSVQYWDGASWAVADTWTGDGSTDGDFAVLRGTIVDPAAMRSDLQLRLDFPMGAGSFYIDDLLLTCGVDLDGDASPDFEDCDDGDSAHWLDCGLCVDADRDDYGVDCDLGDDCDDTDDTVHPGADDAIGDGFDTDCDLVDGTALIFDDFESGSLDPEVWDFLGFARMDTDYVDSGVYSLQLGTDTSVWTLPIDTRGCPHIEWQYRGKRGPDQPDSGEYLEVSWYDGQDWIVVDAWEGGAIDADFSTRAGAIDDPDVLRSDAQFLLERVGGTRGYDEFYVDDFAILCPLDSDGDGTADTRDCSPSDGAHWDDCGRCLDADGDDYGVDCDLGPDCDDADGTTSPGAFDPIGDQVDQNCDGIDGLGVLLTDDFETGDIDTEVWSSITGNYAYDFHHKATGTWSLTLAGGIGDARTVPMASGPCAQGIRWSFMGKRGPDRPEAGEFLNVEYWNGSAWIVHDAWEGDGVEDADFSYREGTIYDPMARSSSFQLRFVTSESAWDYDNFYIDDLQITCAWDQDGDGVDLAFDCDDHDGDHWSDCGLCSDPDGDGYGVGCDLGDDCDESDPGLNPGIADLYGDGVDTNCDGVDGVGITWSDDFETGDVDYGLWDAMIGNFSYSSEYVGSGNWSLNLSGGIGEAYTVPLDTRYCFNGIEWSYMGKRGPDTPDWADFLRVDYWNGSVWVAWDVWYGSGVTDAAFSYREGIITDPLAQAENFQVRLYSDGSGNNIDDYYIDDFELRCAP